MQFAISRTGIYQIARKIIVVMTLLYVLCFFAYLVAYRMIGDGFWPLALVNTFAYAIFIPLVVLLPLVLLTRSRLGMISLLPIMGIFLVWAFPYLKGRPNIIPAKNAIRILTSNTLWNNANREDMLRWLREADADVILLQEISYDVAGDLRELTDAYPYQPVSITSEEWGGNLILSRIPILSFDYVDLGVPKTMQPQRITFLVNGKTYAAYNIHLEWPVGSERPLKAKISRFSTSLGFAAGYDDTVRNLQIERLVTRLQDEPYPYFMAGDFNISDQSPSYNQLASVGVDAFREAGSGFGATWPVADVQRLPSFVPPLIRIDYVFHSDGFRAISAQPGEPMGSDHLPLLVILEPGE